MNAVSWENHFSDLFHHSVARYQKGHQKADGFFQSDEQAYLASIGHTGQELFDFVEDFAKGGDPSLPTVLAIAAVRRDYFLKVQSGKSSAHHISVAALPAKDAQLAGIPWLPRLIAKAEAKLRGEMPPELMYGCGGDRRFFREYHIDAAEFLREVWQAHGDKTLLVECINRQKVSL